MMIDLFPDKRSYCLGQLEANISTSAPVLQIIATGKRNATHSPPARPNEDDDKQSRQNEEENKHDAKVSHQSRSSNNFCTLLY